MTSRRRNAAPCPCWKPTRNPRRDDDDGAAEVGVAHGKVAPSAAPQPPRKPRKWKPSAAALRFQKRNLPQKPPRTPRRLQKAKQPRKKQPPAVAPDADGGANPLRRNPSRKPARRRRPRRRRPSPRKSQPLRVLPKQSPPNRRRKSRFRTCCSAVSTKRKMRRPRLGQLRPFQNGVAATNALRWMHPFSSASTLTRKRVRFCKQDRKQLLTRPLWLLRIRPRKSRPAVAASPRKTKCLRKRRRLLQKS